MNWWPTWSGNRPNICNRTDESTSLLHELFVSLAAITNSLCTPCNAHLRQIKVTVSNYCVSLSQNSGHRGPTRLLACLNKWVSSYQYHNFLLGLWLWPLTLLVITRYILFSDSAFKMKPRVCHLAAALTSCPKSKWSLPANMKSKSCRLTRGNSPSSPDYLHR